MYVDHLSTHWAGSLGWQGQRTLLQRVSSSETSVEGPFLLGYAAQRHHRGSCGDVVSTQNNSLLAHEITASLSLEIKRGDPSSAPPGQDSRSSAGQESGEKREPCCLRIDLPLISLISPAFILFYPLKPTSSPKLLSARSQRFVPPEMPGKCTCP